MSILRIQLSDVDSAVVASAELNTSLTMAEIMRILQDEVTSTAYVTGPVGPVGPPGPVADISYLESRLRSLDSRLCSLEGEAVQPIVSETIYGTRVSEIETFTLSVGDLTYTVPEIQRGTPCSEVIGDEEEV